MTSVQERRIRVDRGDARRRPPRSRAPCCSATSRSTSTRGTRPLAERRAAALTLDPSLLGELLGQTDLRDLLEPDAIAQVVAQIQHLTEERRARGPEDAVDMLRILGPLSDADAGLRGVEPDWLEELEAQRRVLRTRVAGRDVWAGVEDAARLRDGLGAPIPAGVADAHLRPGGGSARPTSSPATAAPTGPSRSTTSLRPGPAPCGGRPSAVDRVGLPGRVIEGWFVPGLPGPQWCHPDVLRLIKRRSVAMLRQQIEPVSQAALATFLPRWQNIGRHGSTRLRGPDGVLQAIRAMAGVAVPASALEESILPLRVPGYTRRCSTSSPSTGEVLWTGSAPLPGGDGWIALAPADVGFLLPRAPSTARRSGGLGGAGPAALRRGVVRRRPPTPDDRAPTSVPGHLAQALLELLWAGLVSNDTIEPLRVMLDRSRGRRRRSPAGAGQRPRRPARGRYADLWRPATRRELCAGSGRAGRADVHPATRGRREPGTAGAGITPELPGRWFALPAELPPREVVALARAEAHLDRLGIVTRGAVLASGDPGGFAAAYRTLSMMEERGRVQRVYAVEGLGASQFALTGVVDQVRAVERELAEGQAEHLLLATADPANPYGAALEWPASDWAGRPRVTAPALRGERVATWC